ncbi:MAG: ribosome maturation factor RimM [Pseudomonadota bacterium]
MAQKRILMGVIATAHGVRGDVLVKAYTAVPEDVARYGPLESEDGAQRFALTIKRSTPKGLIARIEGVGDRDAALALRGMKLFVPRERLPAPAEDEFYIEDLRGMAVLSPEGSPLGRVHAVHNFGAGDLIEVAVDGARDTVLIPFTKADVPVLDLTAGHIVVVLPAEDTTQNEAEDDVDDEGEAKRPATSSQTQEDGHAGAREPDA